MLMMEADNSGFLPPTDLSADDNFDDFDVGDGPSMDLDTLIGIIDEESRRQQSDLEELAQRNMPQGDFAPESSQLQSEFQLEEYTSFQALLRVDTLDGSFDHNGKPETSTQSCAPVQASSASFKEWVPAGQGTIHTERAGMSLLKMPSCITAATSAEVDCIPAIDHGDDLNFGLVDNRTVMQLNNTAEEFNCKDALCSPPAVNMDFIFDYGVDIQNNTLENLEASETKVATYNFPFFGRDMSSHNVTTAESTIGHGSDVISDVSDPHSVVFHCLNGDDAYFADSSTHYLPSSLNHMFEEAREGEVVEFPTESACSSSRVVFNAQVGADNRPMSQQQYSEGEVNEHFSPNFSFRAEDRAFDDKELVQPFNHSQSCISNNKKMGFVMNDGKIFSHSVEALDKSVSRKSSNNCEVSLSIAEYSKESLSGISPSISNQGFASNGKDAYPYYQDFNLNVSSHCAVGGGHMSLTSSEQYFSGTQPIVSTKMELGCFGNERENMLIPPRSIGLSKVSPESIHSNSSDCRSHVDDDPDICVLEAISQPARSNQSLALVKKTPTLLNTTVSNPLHNSGMGGIRFKGKDDRSIFRVALQGLSQPKFEASPPDGVLTVPLLRHQRIALSWMSQKEKAGSHCLGGILADDQGLGKTVSTIALILKERPPSSRESSQDMRKVELETLHLDDDDDDDDEEEEGFKRVSDDNEVVLNGVSMKSSSPSGQAKGRPAAGTLIVCPTSVMRQWAEELHNKVSSKANLSVLVYHGSNRTKDPFELAKYDVVVTTYSIVSMEVPKQPPVQGDDDEKGKFEGEIASSMDFQPSRKRKYPPSSSKKGVKHKKGVDEMLLDSASRPLAKVGWFRIVLDEAQSIKNHRTQVARACWGLRAKRRWCLSGTPIQNAIDDLYSYFRFLRYDPYAAYKSFCSSIKFPITKNPAKGYAKLQAILQTVMLRRTKGTLLDGKPIINLPPKVIELKKVEFTKEERDFYLRLETDSRAQFKEYADAGTVKQNYVNILLMLLRLRQACDHPLLVRDYGSNTVWRTSTETAKKLPQEKLTFLLSCLASLALCGICNDPPEDAVVAVCGHVFCNQCISEHLSGDDNQCPSTHCKVRLNASSVFSNAALHNCLSLQSGRDSSLDSSVSQDVEVTGPRSEDSVYDSSKIKAALEVLKSLAKTQDHRTKSSGYPEGSFDLNSGDPSNGSPGEKDLVVSNGLNDSSKVLGEKAIVFSQWTRMLDLFEACLKSSSIQYRRLDGTMSVAARDKAVKDFNTLPEVSVMIMSLKAASLGLNMVAACHVLLLDLWWNPTTEDQAIDRAHRIGQTRPVTVLRYTVKDTVEDRILALQQKKRKMVASAFGEDETGCRQSHLSVEDLEYLFMAQ